MKWEIRGRFLMGDLTMYVEADDKDGAITAAARSGFGDTLTMAKEIYVIPVMPHTPVTDKAITDE